MIQNPCLKCKRKPDCPRVCYPKSDYDKAVRRNKKAKNRKEKNHGYQTET